MAVFPTPPWPVGDGSAVARVWGFGCATPGWSYRGPVWQGCGLPKQARLVSIAGELSCGDPREPVGRGVQAWLLEYRSVIRLGAGPRMTKGVVPRIGQLDARVAGRIRAVELSQGSRVAKRVMPR